MIIGIVGRVEEKENKNIIYVDEYFKDIIDKLGFTLIPIVSDESLKRLVDICDGLIIPGNKHDINPVHYHEELNDKTKLSNIDEFILDKKCILEFNKRNKKILGICSGHQAINITFGGTLYQDIDNHGLYDGGLHDAMIKDDSILNNIFKEKEIKVNSTHHQAIKDVADGFKVGCVSPDGVIESIEKDNILGVQWHPEKLLDYNFFKSFFEE